MYSEVSFKIHTSNYHFLNFHYLGWSFGGVVAFHMACELIRAGIKVSGVVLIDSPSPFSHEILSDDLINSVIHEKSHSNVNSQQTNLSQLARKQMSYATRALVDYDPLCFSSNTSVYPNVVMLRCEDSFISDCSPKNTFLEDRDEPEVITCDWEKLIGKKIPILDIPGHHFEPFSPKNVSKYKTHTDLLNLWTRMSLGLGCYETAQTSSRNTRCF